MAWVDDFDNMAFSVEFGEGSSVDNIVHDSSDTNDIDQERADEPEIRRKEDLLEISEQVESEWEYADEDEEVEHKD